MRIEEFHLITITVEPIIHDCYIILCSLEYVYQDKPYHASLFIYLYNHKPADESMRHTLDMR